MLDDLRAKAVLVTGASSGIGAAVAKGFGRYGARVVVHYKRSEAEAEAVTAAVREAGGEAITVQGDVTRKGDLQRIFERTVAASAAWTSWSTTLATSWTAKPSTNPTTPSSIR